MKQTIRGIRQKKKREKITALTAYDYLFAGILDRAELDIILVGDSLGMVLLGHASNLFQLWVKLAGLFQRLARGAVKRIVLQCRPEGELIQRRFRV